MKAILFVLQAFVLVFFLGCQESNITDPGAIDDSTPIVQSSQTLPEVSYKDLASSYPKSIIVSQLIYDPTHPANISEPIKGIIRYNNKLVPKYSALGTNQYRVQIDLLVDLILDANCPRNHDCMKITASSTETVNFYANFDQVKYFEKVFRVNNTCCGDMNLVLKFSAGKKDISLASMSLKKIFRSTDDYNSTF